MKKTSRKIWSNIVTFAILVVAIIAFVLSVFGVGHESLLFLAHDVREILPDRVRLYSEALTNGRLPLWNPYTYSGMPFLANPATAVFYPTTLLFLWLTPATGVVTQLAIHLVLAGAGMYLWARIGFARSRGAALFAALIYSMSGRVVGDGFAGHTGLLVAYAYVPMLAFAIGRAADRVECSDPLASIASKVRTMGAWPWFAAILVALQVFSGGLQLVWLGIVFIGLLRLGLLLSDGNLKLAHWAREIFLISLVTAVGMLISAIQLIPSAELAASSDRPSHFEYASFGSFPPAMFVTMLNPRRILAGNELFWEYYGYVGILPVLLAAWGLIRFRNDSKARLLLFVGAFWAFFMLGKHFALFPLLWKHVPSFNIFRVPARAIFAVQIAIALLAAYGIDGTLAECQRRCSLSARLGAALVGLACIVTWLDIVGAAQWYQRWLHLPYYSDLLTNMDTRRPEIIERRELHATTLDADSSWYRFWFDAHSLRRNYAMEHGRHSIGGYDSMMIGRYSNFLHVMTGNNPSANITFADPIAFNSPIAFPFKILGVKYMNHEDALLAQHRQTLRAWFVTEQVFVPNESEVLDYMNSDLFRRYDEVVYEASDEKTYSRTKYPAAEAQSYVKPAINVIDGTPEELHIEIGPHSEGVLVLSEIFYPGWHAFAGGTELAIQRCNSILRCIVLDESNSTTQIKLRFSPRSLRIGAWISILALATAIFLVIFTLRPQRFAN